MGGQSALTGRLVHFEPSTSTAADDNEDYDEDDDDEDGDDVTLYLHIYENALSGAPI